MPPPPWGQGYVSPWGVEGSQGATELDNCRRAPPEAAQLKD